MVCGMYMKVVRTVVDWEFASECELRQFELKSKLHWVVGVNSACGILSDYKSQWTRPLDARIAKICEDCAARMPHRNDEFVELKP